MPKNSSGYLREDWQKHYDEKDLRWDIGQVSPPFVRLWEKGLFQKLIVIFCNKFDDSQTPFPSLLHHFSSIQFYYDYQNDEYLCGTQSNGDIICWGKRIS